MSSGPRYIFVVGGVLSGLGKGIAVSSIAKLLQGLGYRSSAVKIDPYINVDAGTMNPTEHGEVFVTKDGLETDQDIGNYERFLDIELTRDSYMTTGQVYLSVIQAERNLEYRGKCVEVVPHVPEEVIRRLQVAAKKTRAEILLVEIGGTVGEYQNLIFLEAARMLNLQQPGKVQFILVSYLPVPDKIGEMKTKPTQYATRTLNSAGIQPNFILARGAKPLDQPRREKISIFCNVPADNVVSAPDVDSIYEVPLNFAKEKLGHKILKGFDLAPRGRDLKEWQGLVRRIKHPRGKVRIAMVGKYFATGNFTLADSYISVIEAVKHASWANSVAPEFIWVNSEDFETNPSKVKELANYDGVIVPQGWGSRGAEGKIAAIEFVRRNNIPYLGLCYGMQMAVIEFARHVAKLRGAHTMEADPKTPHPVIYIMPDQAKYLAAKQYGGTIRLGDWPCRASYGVNGRATIQERHRHRYELNNTYRARLEKAGLVISGTSPDGKLVEAIELPDHPFFVGTQFHPEYKSHPLNPHPLFVAFIKASRKRQTASQVATRPAKKKISR